MNQSSRVVEGVAVREEAVPGSTGGGNVVAAPGSPIPCLCPGV